jgi:mono/diheme cytochrome c family protein
VLNVVSMLALVVLFAWLFVCALRSRRLAIKIPGMILSGLLALLLAAITVVAALGFAKLETRHSNPVAKLQVAGTPDMIARGGQIAWGCSDGHSPNRQPPLSGSTDNLIAGGPPMGTLFVPNLTPAGPLATWSDGEIVRAIREGIAKDGRALVAMPSQAYRNLSDSDVQAVVAYLRSQPAVVNPQPARDLNVVAAVFLGAGVFPTSAQEPRGTVSAPPSGPTAEYGAYLVSSLGGCRDCHGDKLDGVPSNSFAPAGPNIKAVVPHWQESDFVALFRTGKRPGGSAIGEEMPWANLGKSMSDEDLRAVYAYLKQ